LPRQAFAPALNRLTQSHPVKPGQTISLALTMRGKSMEVPVHQPFTHHPMKLQTETSQTQSNLVKPLFSTFTMTPSLHHFMLRPPLRRARTFSVDFSYFHLISVNFSSGGQHNQECWTIGAMGRWSNLATHHPITPFPDFSGPARALKLDLQEHRISAI
jgi:hypothetical protein